MEQAIKRLQAVPEGDQDRVAEFLLHELTEDEKWTRSTDDNPARVARLIDLVRKDDADGRCRPLDPERL